MKKYHLSLVLLALGFGLSSCGESGATETTITKTVTSEKEADTTSSSADEATTSSMEDTTTTESKVEETTTTSVVKGMEYTGAAYDDVAYSEGNITVSMGSADLSYNNEKINISYDIKIKNNSNTYQDIGISDVKLFSNADTEFTAYCSSTFDKKSLSGEASVGLYGGYAVTLHISAAFTDTERNSDTAYYNTFTLTDSGHNVYYVTASPDEASKFYEKKTVTLYEDDECTLDNGFKFAVTGTSGYNENSYCFRSTDVLSITNTGSDAECIFSIGSMSMYSISEEGYALTSFSPSATLNDQSFYNYYDETDFTSGSVFTIDFKNNYYGVSESNLPVKTTFRITDLTGKINYDVTLMMTFEEE